MGISVWMFLRRAPGEVVPFPATRFRRLFDGEEAFGAPGIPQEFFEVAVGMEARVATRVHRTVWFKMPVGPDGRFPKQEAIRAAVEHFWAQEYLSGKDKSHLVFGPATEAETLPQHADALRLEVLYAADHRWEPTAEDLEALCIAVNRRAKRELLRSEGQQLFYV